jgi:anti-sigma factor RsiW
MSEHLREEEFIHYVDGRADAAERARLGRHLAACADCRGRVDELRGLLGVLGEWQAAAPSPRFDAALRARLEQEPAPATPWYALRPAYAAALAAVVVLVLGVYLWPPTPPEVPVPVTQMPPPPVAPSAPTGVEPARPAVPAGQGTDELAAFDNPVLIENYELLEEFDVLFEPVPPEKKKSL